MVLAGEEDRPICYPSFRWARALDTRHEIAITAQFLSTHFPCRSYLYRFHHEDTPDCDACGVPEDGYHILMTCPRWEYHREALANEIDQDRPATTATRATQEWSWSWRFLTGSDRGRVYLARFLQRIRPRWQERDVCRLEVHSGGASQSSAGGETGDAR